MTAIQLEYQKLQETKRHNQRQESLSETSLELDKKKETRQAIESGVSLGLRAAGVLFA